MNMGIGITEIMVIAGLVLVLFGPKELPHMFRDIARIFAKLKLYSDKIKRELDEAIKLEEPSVPYENETEKKKKNLRAQYRSNTEKLTAQEKIEKSDAIWKHCITTPEYQNAKTVMIYVSIGDEVATRTRIVEMLYEGKRVIIPFYKALTNELGIAEIKDFEKDLADGAFGIPEPVEILRNNFFKSDLQLILCPAVAFDIYGSRLGRGKGFYDMFLKEIKGRVSIFGFGYDCQIYQQNLPFDYHDVTMDQIITESGLILKK
jgi:5-formyltetrahydrofolate cyclo-ligase